MPKLTSDHLQLNVLLDVIEPTRDLYAAAVCTCIFCLQFLNGERHISVGNIALETVPLRFSERHPASSGVQNFVIALWIRARASAPAHVGDVLLSCHVVGARQLDSLPYYTPNSFGCSVRCQGRTGKDECWQFPMCDSTCATLWGRKGNSPACRQARVTDPPSLPLEHLTTQGTTGSSQELTDIDLLLECSMPWSQPGAAGLLTKCITHIKHAASEAEVCHLQPKYRLDLHKKDLLPSHLLSWETGRKLFRNLVWNTTGFLSPPLSPSKRNAVTTAFQRQPQWQGPK